jgi:hypothetical protein
MDGMERIMSFYERRIMIVGLIVLYGIAWGLASIWRVQAALCFLSITAFILTLPYFLWGIVRGMAKNILVSIVIVALATIFPPAIILGLVWKFGKLLIKLPLIYGGMLIYASIIFPKLIKTTACFREFEHYSIICPIISPLIFMVMGICLVSLAIYAFGKCGYGHPASAALLLGFTSYLMIFLVTILLPSGDADADSDGDSEGYGSERSGKH